MRNWKNIEYWLFIVLFIISCRNTPDKFTSLERPPAIFPDYTSLVIPPNIAPLNFSIEEEGHEYMVDIYSKNGDKISIRQKTPHIRIPAKAWRRLLEQNRGEALLFDVYARRDNWYKYAAFSDTIAPENIDNNLVYRNIGIVYTYYDEIGIVQRDLESFETSTIYNNTSNDQLLCMNCHSFSGHDPGKMSIHFRVYYPGTVIYDHGELQKFNTKTEYTLSPGVYTAWHPNGELIAYSVNKLLVNYSSSVDKIVEVWDAFSDILLYDIRTNTLSTCPGISTKSRENLPNWSPDGKYLYFINAPEILRDESNLIHARYDLMRIGFHAETREWGDVDTVLSSKQTGKSITFPNISPDGRYILFSMIDHSYFSIFDKNSDLYLLDLESGAYREASALNSPATDSYHTWSKNGRWVVFSSKRLDEVCTHPYFAYFDDRGRFHKPFILPQEDPRYYLSNILNYNLPVLVDGKVEISTRELRDFITQDAEEVGFDESISSHFEAVSGATTQILH